MRHRFFTYTLLLSLFSFLSFPSLLAQKSDSVHVFEEFSLRGELGASFIAVSGEKESHMENGVSGSAGLAWIHHYKGVSFFRMEFGVSVFNSTNTVHDMDYVDDDGDFVRKGTITTRKRMSYLSIPFLYGVDLRKFSIAAGVQFGMLMGGDETVDSDNGPYDPIYQFCSLSSNTFDYGGRFTASYELSHKLHIESSYYHGLSDVVSGTCKDKNEKWKLSQLTLGVRYSMHFHVPDPTTRQIRKELREMEE